MAAKGRSLKSLVRTLLPRGVHPHLILGGPLRGLRIVTSWHDYPAAILGTTEAALLGWIAANVRAGETWLDVGAHYGYTALALCRHVGSTGRVFAFEPVLTTAADLDDTRKRNGLRQLTIIPIALGGDQPLSVIESSLDRGMATHLPETGLATRLCVIGLDQLWPGINGNQPRIDGVKIDVQGMEEQTVRGMLGVLRQWRPKLIIEFHPGADRSAILRDLLSAGYLRTAFAIHSPQTEAGDYLDDCSYLFVAERAQLA